MKSLLALLLLLPTLLSCSESDSRAAQPASAGDRLAVHVVNHPLQYFAERIGGEHVVVTFPAPADVDPALWEPDAEAIGGYQQADLILLNGASYAKWTAHATLPASRLVDTCAALGDRLIAVAGSVTHAHGPEGEHSHGEVAFTTWLDPTLALEQARAVLASFDGARPEHAASFRESFAGLEEDLLALDARLAEVVARGQARALVGSHPVYQYLDQRYALGLRSVHWEPDALPDEGEWQALQELLDEEPAWSMLWEGPPLAATRARLEELGVRTCVYAPAGNRTQDGDWLAQMHANAHALAEALAR